MAGIGKQQNIVFDHVVMGLYTVDLFPSGIPLMN
jgi:hypothetical protein